MSKNPYLLHGNELDRTEAARRAGQSQPAPRVDSALNPKAAWPFPKTKAEIEAEANAKPRAGEHERTTQYYACSHGIPGGCQFCNATRTQGEHSISVTVAEWESLKAERDARAAQKDELAGELQDLLFRFERICIDADGQTDPADARRIKQARALLAKHGR